MTEPESRVADSRRPDPCGRPGRQARQSRTRVPCPSSQKAAERGKRWKPQPVRTDAPSSACRAAAPCPLPPEPHTPPPDDPKSCTRSETGRGLPSQRPGRPAITVGNGVFIGPKVNLITINHDADPENRSATYGRPIVIEDKVWIGINSTILPGVRIGYGAIVGANSVVTKDVPPMTIVAGNPARIVKKIEPGK